MNLSATAAPTEAHSEQLSRPDEAWNISPRRCEGVPSLPLQRVLSCCILHSARSKRQRGPCTSSNSVLILVHGEAYAVTYAGRSLAAYSIPGAAGKRAECSGLPSHSLLARLLESQHKPPYPLLWSKPLSNVFSYPSKGLKEAAL